MKLNQLWINVLLLLAMLAIVCPLNATEKKNNPVVANSDTYRIGAGDTLEVVTWKEPDFTANAPVRNDGMITFVLLGDLQAAGKTPAQLKQDIEKGLQEYVGDPIVTVFVREMASQRFYILGEVINTGPYPLLTQLTVLQAFALAGGFTEWASKSEILLLRNIDGKQKVFRINYKDIVKGKDITQNIEVLANDTIIVP